MAEPQPRQRGRASTAGNATQKALRVLEAAAAPNGPHRLADIAARAAVAKPTTHRLLVMLVADGYLTADGGGRYGVGPRLHAFAAEVSAHGPRDIAQLLRSLQQVVGGHTVHLALRSGDHAIYIQKIDSDQPYQMASRVGISIPLHCTAIGKCILAYLPPDELDRVIAARGLPGRTPATITDRPRLDAELAYIRDRGYAVDDEENETTIRCVAAPVFDAARRPLGGVSVSTVTFAVSREKLESFVPDLIGTADGVSRMLSEAA
ncbi:MAG TPA: IclR family transcriptional regulator [Streptosporangiaceae bacterium]|nr:IclR family transcriptional regulator [Streptosporangiaceae bacterium]